MSVKINGIDGIIKKLDKLGKDIQNLEGEHQIPVTDLLNTSFMNKYTTFEDAQEFVDGCEKVCGADFSEIDEMDEKFNDFIKENTSFNNWSELMEKASGEWITEQIHF